MKILTKTWVTILVITSVGSSVFASTFSTNFSLGSKNDEIKVIQQFLVSQGFLFGSPTNYFGAQTKKAVQTFQKKNGLPATGVWSTLTRQKAESVLLKNKQVISTTTGLLPARETFSSTSFKNSTSSFDISPKNVVLTISTVGYGYVLDEGNALMCSDNEICNKNFPINKKIILKAAPRKGYSLLSWSEANCGDSLECSVKLVENMNVYARFGVKRLSDSSMGKITSLQHPKDTCYILLGRDSCDIRLAWITNTSYDMTIKKDSDEYYVVGKDDTFWKTVDLDPEELAKSNNENASGVVYLSLFQGSHKISLNKGHSQILDSVIVEVSCEPDSYWDGTKCWKKDAYFVYVFKTNGYVVKSDPPGMRCGYNPEMCAMAFSSSTPVKLRAEMLPGYTFGSWYGDCSGTQSTCTLIMDKTKSVGVKFTGGVVETVKNILKVQSTEQGPVVPNCVPNWKCDDWSKCLSMKQTRYCGDLNKCNNPLNKPQIELSCTPATQTLPNSR